MDNKAKIGDIIKTNKHGSKNIFVVQAVYKESVHIDSQDFKVEHGDYSIIKKCEDIAKVGDKIRTIKKYQKNDTFTVEEVHPKFLYVKEHEELIFHNNYTVLKNDTPKIENGMVVKLRNGDLFLVLENTLIQNGGYMYLPSYSEDLKFSSNSNYDIVEVYKCSGLYVFGAILDKNTSDLQLIWDRAKIEDITIDEAEKIINNSSRKIYRIIK